MGDRQRVKQGGRYVGVARVGGVESGCVVPTDVKGRRFQKGGRWVLAWVGLQGVCGPESMSRRGDAGVMMRVSNVSSGLEPGAG